MLYSCKQYLGTGDHLTNIMNNGTIDRISGLKMMNSTYSLLSDIAPAE